jgi:hypothetical protein
VIANAVIATNVAFFRFPGTQNTPPIIASAINPAMRIDVVVDSLRLFVLPDPVVLIVAVIVVALEMMVLALSKVQVAAAGRLVHDMLTSVLNPPDGLNWIGT